METTQTITNEPETPNRLGSGTKKGTKQQRPEKPKKEKIKKWIPTRFVVMDFRKEDEKE
jgi:hypothetical protein